MTQSVHIAGAGPAGCATAISLQKRARELGVDIAVNIILPADKGLPLIGETIPPAATQYLNELGLAHLLTDTHLECPGSVSIWGSELPGHNDFLYTPVGKGYHLDRAYFNWQLLQACQESGVELLSETKVIHVKNASDGFALTLQSGDETKIIHSDFIVDASGIQASLARSMGVARNEYDSVISLCAFYDLPLSKNMPAHTLVSTSACGWWYATRLPGDKVLISLCTDGQTLKQNKLNEPEIWFHQFQNSGWLYEACANQFNYLFDLPINLHVRVAPSSILSNCMGDHWLAVGDAASSYDSITSAGITKALAHGKLAGQEIANYLKTPDELWLGKYQQKVFDDFNHYIRLHQQLYGAETRYPESEFWQRRVVLGNGPRS